MASTVSEVVSGFKGFGSSKGFQRLSGLSSVSTVIEALSDFDSYQSGMLLQQLS